MPIIQWYFQILECSLYLMPFVPHPKMDARRSIQIFWFFDNSKMFHVAKIWSKNIIFLSGVVNAGLKTCFDHPGCCSGLHLICRRPCHCCVPRSEMCFSVLDEGREWELGVLNIDVLYRIYRWYPLVFCFLMHGSMFP